MGDISNKKAKFNHEILDFSIPGKTIYNMACRLSGFVFRKSGSIYSSTQITRISKTFSAYSPKINQLSCIQVQYQMNQKNMCTDSKKPQKIDVALEFILPEHVLKAVNIP